MQPPSFDEEWTSDWSNWSLDHGLPDLPDELLRGESVPVARWVDGAFGAVLHVQWSHWPEQPEDDQLVSEIEVFHRSGDEWESSLGGGGGGWIDPPFDRGATAPRLAQLMGLHGSGARDWYTCAYYGVAGVEAKSIQVLASGEDLTMPIESPFGAFVVAFDAHQPATVSIRDESGQVLLSKDYDGRLFERGSGIL